jgi:hypothetical protein
MFIHPRNNFALVAELNTFAGLALKTFGFFGFGCFGCFGILYDAVPIISP